MSKPRFDIKLLPEAVDFLDSLDEKSRDKVLYNLKKAQLVVDNELLKKLNETIWEFRTIYNGNSYRLFAFWDKTESQQTLVISTHGINKKSQKTPFKEISKAEEIRKQYILNKSTHER
jgi:phage-related protein